MQPPNRTAVLVTWLVALSTASALPQGDARIQGQVYKNENAEISRHNPIQLGQVSGIATDDSGNLYAFHRGSRRWQADSFDFQNNFNTEKYGPIQENTMVVFGKDGKVLWSGGANRFYMPHGLSLDNENVWVTDVGLHQVLKFPKASDEPSLVLGTAFKNGNDNLHFCKPTDVAVARDGTIFVADGYCNSRIVKFSPDGKFAAEWGQPVDGSFFGPYPPAGQFSVPHSLTLIQDWDLLCVGDRENERIQCFSAGLGLRGSPTGTFVKKAEGLGRVFAVDNRDHYLAGVTGESREGSPKLFIVDLNTGNSEIIDKGINSPHDVSFAPDTQGGFEAVYVADIGSDPGIQKVDL